MNVLTAGAASLIGTALTLRLLERGDMVIDIDNYSDHYGPSLKEARLAMYVGHPGHTQLRIDLGLVAIYDS